MEFDKSFFGYDPEKDKDRPIKFKLDREHNDWYAAYWKFDDEVEPETADTKRLGFIRRLINKLKSVHKNIRNPWKTFWMYLNPYVDNSVEEGWMGASWEFHNINDLLSQLNYLTHRYPTIKHLYESDLREINKCEAFIKWKREVDAKRRSMPDSCE